MKKLYGILILAMLAMCSVAIVSCGDDDEDALVGTWYLQDGDELQQITAASNHTYVNVYYDLRNGQWIETETEHGTWSVDGDKLTLKDSEGDVIVFTFKVDGKKLTLTRGSYSMVFTKR